MISYLIAIGCPIALFIVLLCFYPKIKKWLYIQKGNYITIKTKLIIFLKYVIEKHGLIIGFLFGFSFALFIFEWKDGIVIDYIKLCIDNFVLIATDIVEKAQEKLLYIEDILIYISPYGRVDIADKSMMLLLNIGSVCSLICFGLFFIIAFGTNAKHRILKLMLTVLFAFFLWYTVYYICNIVIINISAVSVFLSCVLTVIVCAANAFVLLFPFVNIILRLD